jgi:Cft2 family RNA processing exonuclease
MELQFFGATGETTGSCHQISANGVRILLDCGLFQGRRERTWLRNREFEFDAQAISAVLQSHAHIDHSGRLPLLGREGFHGVVHATPGTRDLCEILLHDSAYIQVKDAQEINRRRAREELRRGRKAKMARRYDSDPQGLGLAQLPEQEVLPLYLDEDVHDVMQLFRTHPHRSTGS